MPRKETNKYPVPKAKFAITQYPNPPYVFLSRQYTVIINPRTKGINAEISPMVRTSRSKLTSLPNTYKVAMRAIFRQLSPNYNFKSQLSNVWICIIGINLLESVV